MVVWVLHIVIQALPDSYFGADNGENSHQTVHQNQLGRYLGNCNAARVIAWIFPKSNLHYLMLSVACAGYMHRMQ